MINFLILLNLFLILKSAMKRFFMEPLLNNQKDKNFLGYDERYINETDPLNDNIDLLIKIRQNFYKLRLLKYLENEKISIIDKVKLVEDYEKNTSESKYKANLFSGGLLKDWDNFNFHNH
jgi:hypothetical protein